MPNSKEKSRSGTPPLTPAQQLTKETQNSLVLNYLKQLSGQEKETSVIELDHAYNKPWNHHPDERLRTRPARFLFMKDFPRHLRRRADRHIQPEQMELDVVDLPAKEEELLTKNYLAIEAAQLGLKTSPYDLSDTITNLDPEEEKMSPNMTNWTPTMQKLWDGCVRILQSERLARLAQTGSANELISRKNLADRTCARFRYLFASVAQWDMQALSWLHTTLVENLSHTHLLAYVESMHQLRARLPSLVDRFFVTVKSVKGSVGVKVARQQLAPDPVQIILSNHKPKRISGSPLFLIVPNGPLIAHQLTSQRMKLWHGIFGSLGKVITVNTTNNDASLRTVDCLKQIRFAVREKVLECKSSFSENRPLVLVGFGHSSLIAASCALENANHVTTTVCLGFPLTGVNGFRGDLDDPLLDSTVPTLFVIGQNSTMCTLDDMEDFRERFVKTDTGLVVVGGANDRLVVSNNKKRHSGVTQAMVDRAIADEIYDFVKTL